MILSIILSETVPRFEIVMGLIGGTLTGPLMFVFPALFYIKVSNIMKNKAIMYFNTDINYESIKLDLRNVKFFKKSAVDRGIERLYEQVDFCLPFFIVIFGIVITIVTTYINISEAIMYTSFRPPCIYNFTAASYYVILN